MHCFFALASYVRQVEVHGAIYNCELQVSLPARNTPNFICVGTVLVVDD